LDPPIPNHDGGDDPSSAGSSHEATGGKGEASTQSGSEASGTGEGSSEDETDSSEGADGDADLPGAPSAPAQLRIIRVVFDPDGVDGGPESPERLEILNLGAEAFPLDALHLEARSWPVVDAARLGLEGGWLESGATLRIDRWASGTTGFTEDGVDSIHVGFSHGSGLRNVDGAALVGDGLDGISDLLHWGPELSPAPYDARSTGDAWSGGPVQAETGSLCRVDPWGPELDDASDWQDCEASAPLMDMMP